MQPDADVSASKKVRNFAFVGISSGVQIYVCAHAGPIGLGQQQTLVPVTIKQLQQAMAGDQTSRIDGRDVSQVFTALLRFSLETNPLKR
jgi:hypothetical protein